MLAAGDTAGVEHRGRTRSTKRRVIVHVGVAATRCCGIHGAGPAVAIRCRGRVWLLTGRRLVSNGPVVRERGPRRAVTGRAVTADRAPV